MRTLLRLAAILLVTGAVAGGIYLIVRATPSDNGRQAANDGQRLRGERGGAWSGDERGRGHGRGRTEAAREPESAPDERESAGVGGSSSGDSEAAAPGRRGRPAENGRWPEGQPRTGRESRDGREGHGERGEFSPGRGSAGLLVTSLQVGAVAAVVAVLQSRSRRKTKAKAEPEATN